jgi:hypothetical protein
MSCLSLIFRKLTSPVVFGGTFRRFRRALSLIVGLYNAASIDPKVFVAINVGLTTGKLDVAISNLAPRLRCG